MYDPATKEFSEKLYEDGTYDVGGFTGGCRPGGSISANVNKKTNKLRSLTYAADKPVTIYFDDESNAVNDEVDDEDKEGFSSRQLIESLQSLFPNDWVRVTTSDQNNTKGVFLVYNSNNPGDYYYFDLLKGQVFMLYQNNPWLDRSNLSRKSNTGYKTGKIKVFLNGTKAKVRR